LEALIFFANGLSGVYVEEKVFAKDYCFFFLKFGVETLLLRLVASSKSNDSCRKSLNFLFSASFYSFILG
jgi:hypothetical protein